MKSDLVPILLATAEGRLEECDAPEWETRHAVGVVGAAEGYPGSYRKGDVITGVDAAESEETVVVFQAGTRREGDHLVTAGGRVLCVTALGDDLGLPARHRAALLNRARGARGPAPGWGTSLPASCGPVGPLIGPRLNGGARPPMLSPRADGGPCLGPIHVEALRDPQGLRVVPARPRVEADDPARAHLRARVRDPRALHGEEQGPKVSRATVYRTLSLLVEGGFLESLDTGRGELHYEHVLGHAHHDHMVCLGCGRIEEFVDERIEKLQQEAARAKGFEMVDHDLKLIGYCRACARERRARSDDPGFGGAESGREAPAGSART
jgi:Fe2+ or Zn2+ uptake regulation protein